MYDPGLRHMAISVKDLDAAYASLQSRGVNFLAEPYATASGHRLGAVPAALGVAE